MDPPPSWHLSMGPHHPNRPQPLPQAGPTPAPPQPNRGQGRPVNSPSPQLALPPICLPSQSGPGPAGQLPTVSSSCQAWPRSADWRRASWTPPAHEFMHLTSSYCYVKMSILVGAFHRTKGSESLCSVTL